MEGDEESALVRVGFEFVEIVRMEDGFRSFDTWVPMASSKFWDADQLSWLLRFLVCVDESWVCWDFLVCVGESWVCLSTSSGKSSSGFWYLVPHGTVSFQERWLVELFVEVPGIDRYVYVDVKPTSIGQEPSSVDLKGWLCVPKPQDSVPASTHPTIWHSARQDTLTITPSWHGS